MLLSDARFVESLQPPSVWLVIASVVRPADAGFFTTFAVNVDLVQVAPNEPIVMLTLWPLARPAEILAPFLTAAPPTLPTVSTGLGAVLCVLARAAPAGAARTSRPAVARAT